MSQVKFTATFNGKPCEIMAGWDRPLAEFYLTVFDLDPEADEEVVWSTLDAPDESQAHETGYLRQRLSLMGITPPDGFWERVERREGSVTHYFTQTGWTSY